MKGGSGAVEVDLFGPFRDYGSRIELEVPGEVSFEALVGLIDRRVGSGFAERARKKNTTFIVNRKVVSPDALGSVLVRPGDRVAFALLIGGG